MDLCLTLRVNHVKVYMNEKPSLLHKEFIEQGKKKEEKKLIMFYPEYYLSCFEFGHNQCLVTHLRSVLLSHQ